MLCMVAFCYLCALRNFEVEILMIKFLVCNQGFQEVDSWESEAWVNVQMPTPEDMVYLIDELGIPESFLNDIADDEERPRIEVEKGWRMILLRIPARSNEVDGAFVTVPFGVLMKGDILVSVCNYPAEMINDFITHSRRKAMEGRHNIDLLLSLFISSSVWFLKYLKQINSNIRSAEKELERSIRNEELLRLMKLEKTLVYFITSIRGNEILLLKLKSYLRHTEAQYDRELLEDVDIELQQAHSSADIASNILAGMMDAFASIISNNLNVIMKRLTSVSIILMIPTGVASFYGMNVPNTFEANQWGFLLVILLSILLSIVAVLFFKNRRWL